MLKGREIAKWHLNYVYLGNVANVNSATYCPQCKNLLVERNGYFTKVYIEENRCPEYDYEVNIIL
ncbi:hypothetical protein [Proteiniborus sp.]|uniref:hypothetical protein n=1 Tax=Proteiniborus sp. TaxID=2079015 RepID=UPI00331C20D5